MNWMGLLAGIGFGYILVVLVNVARWAIRMRAEVVRLKRLYPPADS